MPLPTIPSGNVASATAGGFEVANSCRFNDDDTQTMHVTPSSSGDNKTWTLSMWFKRCKLGSNQYLATAAYGNGGRYTEIWFNTSDELVIYGGAYNTSSTSVNLNMETKRVFRDVSAWYSLIIAFDLTDSTESNRVKVYINGTLEAHSNFTQSGSSSSATIPAQDSTTFFNTTTQALTMFGNGTSGATSFDGYIAEVVLIDGTQYAATSFGEFDDDSPTIFKPIDVSGLTFGTNGFYLDFEDSSNLGNNAASGSADLTEVDIAAVDQAVDSPTNNFCTLNSLDNYFMNGTFSEGNCKVATTSAEWGYITGTMGVAKGKWYWEMHMTDPVDTTNYVATGIAGVHDYDSDDGLAYRDDAVAYQGNDGKIRDEGTLSSYGDSYTTNDIISIAVDLDNNTIFFAENGTWKNSGDPANNSNGHSIDAASTTALGFYLPAFGDHAGSSWTNATVSFNFGGCPSFTISSGNADGEGYGNFEYAVPSGFYSLCTKNLAKYG